MVVHFSAASHVEALCNVLSTITATSSQIKLFKNVNAISLELSISDKVESCGQAG